MGFYADFIFRPGIFFSFVSIPGAFVVLIFACPWNTEYPPPPDLEASVSLTPQILKRPLQSRSTNLVVFVHYISRDFFPNDIHEYRVLRLALLRILGDPGAVSRAGRKGARKFSSTCGRAPLFRPCLKTFVAPFLPARLTAPGSPRMNEALIIAH